LNPNFISMKILTFSLPVFLLIIVETATAFIPISTFCQKNYLAGYLILSNGDTITGFIDYRNWENNPGIVFFAKTPDDDKQGYSPVDIKEFGVLDEKYFSAVVETELSSDKTTDLDYDAELNIVKETGFLQALVKGDKSLYLLRSKLGKEQYYIGQDSSYDLLVYKKYLKDQDGKSVIVENRKYIGQLILYLKDCPSLQQKLQNTTYQQNSLEKLFLSYYDCSHSEFDFHKKTEKISFDFGVLAGATFSTVSFRSADFDYLVNAGFQPSYNFSGGAFLDVVLARNNKKWSICNELIFTSYKFKGVYEDYIHENRYTTYASTLGYGYLKLNNLLRYSYPLGNFFLFLNAGLSNGFAIFEQNETIVTSVLFEQERVEEKKALNDSRNYEVGFLGGLGARFKRFSCEARYEYGTGMSAYSGLKSSINRLYLFLGFRF